MPHVTIPYHPRAPFAPFHERSQRWAVLVVHRRGGKTVAGVNELIKGALTCPRVSPRFAYLAPYRQQAKLVAWDYLKRFTQPIPGISISESELHVKLPRDGRVTLYGADNYDALRGIYLDGAVVDEPADMAPEVWTDLLRPALSDRLGWCVWIGTPKGRNAFFRLYDKACSDPEWYTMILPASKSGILLQSELESAHKAMGNASYEREYECSFNAAIPGAIYGDLIEQLRAKSQIQDFPHSKDFPLMTFWDVGDSDFTTIWLLQFEGRHINVLNYYSQSGKTPAHYAEQMRAWERDYDAKILCHYLPHDAAHIRHGSSWKSDLEDAGLRNIKIVPVTPRVWNGINELRTLIPRMYIHKTACSKTFGTEASPIPSGLDCLEFYSKKEQEEGGTLTEVPVHNEFSHGCFPAGTLVSTTMGDIPIEQIIPGMMAITPCGPAEIEAAQPTRRVDSLIQFEMGDGSSLTCTSDHLIFTDSGLVKADALRILDGVWTKHLNLIKSSLTALPISFRAAITSHLRLLAKYTATYIELSGRSNSVPYQRGITSTTRTETDWTTESKTWNAFPNSSTYLTTPKQVLGLEAKEIESNWSNKLCPWRESGEATTPSELVLSQKLQHVLYGKKRSGWSANAEIVDENIERLFQLGQNTARSIVKINRLDVGEENPWVYDLTVKAHHCYLANGVLVSNCDGLRTFAEAHQKGMIEGTSLTARENRSTPPKVLRGPGPDSYSIKRPIQSIRR